MSVEQMQLSGTADTAHIQRLLASVQENKTTRESAKCSLHYKIGDEVQWMLPAQVFGQSVQLFPTVQQRNTKSTSDLASTSVFAGELAALHGSRCSRRTIPGDLLDPSLVKQGSLGSCYLVSAICSLASHAPLILRLFLDCGPPVCPSDNNNDSGATLWLRVFRQGRWEAVRITAALPCVPARQRSRQWTMCFTQPVVQQRAVRGLWASYLESMYAHLYRDYASLEGGNASEALVSLTGLPCDDHQLLGGGVVRLGDCEVDGGDLLRIACSTVCLDTQPVSLSDRAPKRGERKGDTPSTEPSRWLHSFGSKRCAPLVLSFALVLSPEEAQRHHSTHPDARQYMVDANHAYSCLGYSMDPHKTRFGKSFHIFGPPKGTHKKTKTARCCLLIKNPNVGVNGGKGHFWLSVSALRAGSPRTFNRMYVSRTDAYSQCAYSRTVSGQWVSGRSWGGCSSFDTFAHNPMYALEWSPSLDSGRSGQASGTDTLTHRVTVLLQQPDQRALPISGDYTDFKSKTVKDRLSYHKLGVSLVEAQVVRTPWSDAVTVPAVVGATTVHKTSFLNKRDVSLCVRATARKPGRTLCVVPATYQPHTAQTGENCEFAMTVRSSHPGALRSVAAWRRHSVSGQWTRELSGGSVALTGQEGRSLRDVELFENPQVVVSLRCNLTVAKNQISRGMAAWLSGAGSGEGKAQDSGQRQDRRDRTPSSDSDSTTAASVPVLLDLEQQLKDGASAEPAGMYIVQGGMLRADNILIAKSDAGSGVCHLTNRTTVKMLAQLSAEQWENDGSAAVCTFVVIPVSRRGRTGRFVVSACVPPELEEICTVQVHAADSSDRVSACRIPESLGLPDTPSRRQSPSRSRSRSRARRRGSSGLPQRTRGSRRRGGGSARSPSGRSRRGNRNAGRGMPRRNVLARHAGAAGGMADLYAGLE